MSTATNPELLDLTKASPELFAALALAQGEIENAEKNTQNEHLKKSYADLGEVLSRIREVFPKNGLVLIQSPSFDGVNVTVVSVIAHTSGAHITSTLTAEIPMKNIQGVGAAITYLRRYSASSLSGISQEDADGDLITSLPVSGQQRQAPPPQYDPDMPQPVHHDDEHTGPIQFHDPGSDEIHHHGRDDGAPAQDGPLFDRDVTESQQRLVLAKASAAGLDDHGLARLAGGTITPANLNMVLTKLREAASR